MPGSATYQHDWYIHNRDRLLAYRQQWRKDHPKRPTPENQRRWDLSRHYHLTPDAYDALYRQQHGKCAICNTPLNPTGKGYARETTAHVDHDHITNIIRGLLCASCNTGLGKFQNDPTLMQSAIQYLQKGLS